MLSPKSSLKLVGILGCFKESEAKGGSIETEKSGAYSLLCMKICTTIYWWCRAYKVILGHNVTTFLTAYLTGNHISPTTL